MSIQTSTESVPEATTDPSENSDPIAFEPVIAAIKSRPDLRTIPGVFGVRPGLRAINGVLSNEPAIIVVTSPTEAPGVIPPQIDGIAVDVRPATAQEMVEGMVPLSAWEGIVPEAAPHISYTPPDPPLPTEPMSVHNITCHIGPDSGWPT